MCSARPPRRKEFATDGGFWAPQGRLDAKGLLRTLVSGLCRAASTQRVCYGRWFLGSARTLRRKGFASGFCFWAPHGCLDAKGLLRTLVSGLGAGASTQRVCFGLWFLGSARAPRCKGFASDIGFLAPHGRLDAKGLLRTLVSGLRTAASMQRVVRGKLFGGLGFGGEVFANWRCTVYRGSFRKAHAKKHLACRCAPFLNSFRFVSNIFEY